MNFLIIVSISISVIISIIISVITTLIITTIFIQRYESKREVLDKEFVEESIKITKKAINDSLQHKHS